MRLISDVSGGLVGGFSLLSQTEMKEQFPFKVGAAPADEWKLFFVFVNGTIILELWPAKYFSFLKVEK